MGRKWANIVAKKETKAGLVKKRKTQTKTAQDILKRLPIRSP